MATKIMLVEDDTNLSSIYQARLEAEGFQIITANDGEQALAMAVKEHPDLIISDVMMPKISGFDMLDILRGTDGIKDTRVIMMTALGQAEDKARADKLGADRYLVKSQVTLEDVVRTVHEVLDGQPATPMPAGATDSASPATTPNPDLTPEPQAAPHATQTDIPVAEPPSTEPTTRTSQNPAPSFNPSPDPAQQQPTSIPVSPPATSAPQPASQAPDNTQTSSAEQTEVLSQIESFLNKQETEAANPAPEPAPSETKAPDTTGQPIDSDSKDRSEEAEGKKVIQPLDKEPKPDLNALLAKEQGEGKSEATAQPITNTSGSIDGILSPSGSAPHAAGTIIQPTGLSADHDPSSISL